MQSELDFPRGLERGLREAGCFAVCNAVDIESFGYGGFGSVGDPMWLLGFVLSVVDAPALAVTVDAVVAAVGAFLAVVFALGLAAVFIGCCICIG